MNASKMIIFILSICQGGAFGLNQDMFQSYNFHLDSARGTATKFQNDNLSCATECVRTANCKGFYFAPPQNTCHQVRHHGLVPMPDVSTSKFQVFLPQTNQNNYKDYSHFLVIDQNQAIQDFSDSPLHSPPITTFPTTHPSLRGSSNTPCLLEKDGSMTIFEKDGGTRLFNWKFDAQLPQQMPITSPLHGLYLLVASQNGRLFIMGGSVSPTKITIYENGQFRSVTNLPPEGLSGGCAAFLPRDHNLAYFGGGDSYTTITRTSKFWTYNIANDTFTQLAQNYPLGALVVQGCTGAETNTGEKVFVVVGGILQSTLHSTTSVYKYSTSTQSWSPMTAMSQPRAYITALFWKGYIYAFAGYDTGVGAYYSSVIRMLPEDSATWESVGDLKAAQIYPIVVPYS